LKVTTNPEKGLEIYIDGKNSGFTSDKSLNDLKPGIYKIRAQSKYYETEEKEIEVVLGKTETINLQTTANFGTLTIETHPKAEVYLNGIRTYELKDIKLEPQKCNIEIKMKKAPDIKEAVFIKKGESYTKELIPQVATGTVQVAAYPDNAEIVLAETGGETLTATGMQIFKDVPIGDYTLTIKAKGYRTYKKELKIEEGKTVKETNIKLEQTNVVEQYEFKSEKGNGVMLLSENMLCKTLENGLEVVVKKNTSNTSVGFFMFVKSGSIHEEEYTGKGLSHYLEHIVSGGSTKSHTEEWHLNKRKEIGAVSNAYTTFGATVYYIQADKQYADDCLYMLADNIMNCTFDSSEVAREKDVITKEFKYRVDSPIAKLGNSVRNNTFQTSNVRKEVIGDIEMFRKNTQAELIDYYKRRYMPNNCVFVAVGDLDPEVVMTKIEDTFKIWERGVLQPIEQPNEKIRVGNIKYVEEFEINQPRAYITKIVPYSVIDDFAAITMAAQILFEKRNSPVQYKLVEEEKLVNWIYGYFTEGGYFPVPMIQLVFETKNTSNLDGVIKRIDEIIAEVAKKGVTQQQINDVISREKAQKLLKTPSLDTDAQNIGWNMIVYGIPDIFDILMKQYEKLTPHMINEAIKKYFVPENRVVFYGVPQGDKSLIKLTDKQSTNNYIENPGNNLSLKQYYSNKLNNQVDEESTKKVIVSEPEKIVINKDIILLYKQNTDDPVIQGQIFLPISTDYETLENAGLFQFMTDMMLTGGTKKYSSMDLSSWLENHAVRLNSEIGPNGLYISFKCINSDYPELMERIYSIMNEPVFDNKELLLAKEREDASYKRNLSDSENAYDEFRSSVLYKEQRAGLTAKNKHDIIQKLSQDDLRKNYKKYFKSDNLIVTLFGDLTKKEAINYAKELKSKVPSGKISGVKTPLVVPNLNDTFVNECEFDQVNVVLNFQAPLQGDPDYFAMTALNQIMSSGFHGRLIKATRVDNDLVHSAYSYYSGTKDYGFYRIVAQTSLTKKDRLIEVLKNEVKRLIDGDITQEEIDLSVESYAKMLDSYFTDNNIVVTMTRYESIGLGYNFLKESLKDLKKITPKMIKDVANKYLTNAAIFISQPSADVKRVVE